MYNFSSCGVGRQELLRQMCYKINDHIVTSIQEFYVYFSFDYLNFVYFWLLKVKFCIWLSLLENRRLKTLQVD